MSASVAAGCLREIDELARDGEARGFVFVQAQAGVLDALSRHVERRARALGRPLVKVDGLPADDPWRELVARVLPATPVDAIAAAQAILDRAGTTILLVRETAPTTQFGRALVTELVRGSGEGPVRALVLALTEAAPAGTPARLVEVDGELSGDDLQAWWEAIARDPAHRSGPSVDRLDALEAWWAAARATPLSQRVAPPALGPEAARLLARFVISQRSWPCAQIPKLGPAAAAQELLRAGVLALDMAGRLVAGSAPLPEIDADAGDMLAVAAALDAVPDPWAAARAAELFAAAGAFDRAEAAALRAVSTASDPAARADLWRRWERALAAMPQEEALPRLVRGVDLALRSGEVERALDLGNAALAKRPGAFATLLALGRVNVARGDLSTAICWLGKARERTDGSGMAGAAAMVEVELAEVRLLEGDVEGARRHAEAAMAAAGADAATQLHARNVLGKVLLAQGTWPEAEAHFAADACEAALAGDPTAELRARLNRSIALMSSGRLEEARAMFGAVLDDGESQGELRAVAFALANLATICILKHEYTEALRLSERAFEVQRRSGHRVALAILITNTAELKLNLGLVSEAEQALAFGRKACGPGMPGARASHFAYVAALAHLERGRTVDAAAELKIATATALGSSNGARLGECYRLAARIALEDGDLTAAEAQLEKAAELAKSPRERAWIAILVAARARAAGEPFGDAAAEALDRARAADDPELCREAHVLLHHGAVLDGDGRSARAHLDAAASFRDQIADTLPEDLRRRFLARRDLTELARLLAGQPAAAPPRLVVPPVTEAPLSIDAPRPSQILTARPAPSRALVPALRRMVGRTPQMAALASAVLKVGQSDATVLVHGESGTGKELVAEAIHEASARRSGPIVKVNCAALVETLLLSELFGHEKGSFTGAAARRRGRFELAEGGTLFLDEIGDISARTQVALLRVLQDKTFERVGGVTPLRANVRIVCATHRDLGTMVSRGEFREDLYYRLRGVVLEVPPLRQRLADLPLVAGSILERIAGERGTAPKRLSAVALQALGRHPWPGNVRELENALRAAALFAETDVIELQDLTDNVVNLRGLAEIPRATPEIEPAGAPIAAAQECPAADADTAPGSGASLEMPPVSGPVTLSSTMLAMNGTDAALAQGAMAQPSKIAQGASSDAGNAATEIAYATIRAGISLSDLKRDIERDCIARALAETGGNITRAASLLGMKRPRLSQLVKQYGFGGQSGSNGDTDLDAEDGE